MIRRFALAAAAVLALSPLAGLASISSPASAAVTHAAAAARAAMPEACSSYQANNEFGTLYAAGTTAGSELYVSLEAPGHFTWCKDLDGVPLGYELLRLDGTSQCAEYSGPAGGGPKGDVVLAACDSGRYAQLWYVSGSSPDEIVYNDDVGSVACLSSGNPGGPTDSAYVWLVAPKGGCTGAGGQSWSGFPVP
jgi:hypothetical protein